MSEVAHLAVRLALAVYRLTRSFPAGEPLGQRLRELATDVAIGTRQAEALANPVQRAPHEVAFRLRGEIEAMLVVLQLAEPQGFARRVNFSVLARHYTELKEKVPQLSETAAALPAKAATELESPKVLPTASRPEKTSPAEGLNGRQRKVVQHFRSRETFRLREVRALFEGYSQKTLRNDLKELCQKGILKREGVGTASFYRVAAARHLGDV